MAIRQYINSTSLRNVRAPTTCSAAISVGAICQSRCCADTAQKWSYQWSRQTCSTFQIVIRDLLAVKSTDGLLTPAHHLKQRSALERVAVIRCTCSSVAVDVALAAMLTPVARRWASISCCCRPLSMGARTGSRTTTSLPAGSTNSRRRCRATRPRAHSLSR
jgi:hypothetical protein